MDIESQVVIFENKIEEYFLSCLPRNFQYLQDKSFPQESPLHRFNIQSIYKSIRDGKLVPEELTEKCAYKLIDIKLVFCYLLTAFQLFYRGTTLIVGNNEITKLNPNTISLLRADHYKVYLITIVIENILDFFELVFNKRVVSYRKNKWKRILEELLGPGKIGAINAKNIATLLNFEKKYRTAELHKYSAVRAFTSKDKWDHFDDEEQIIRDMIADLTLFFVGKESDKSVLH